MTLRRVSRLGLVLLFFACNAEDETTSGGDPSSCAPGEYRREDGRCVMPGLPPDMPCPPGEWLRDDGLCLKAGIAPDACAEGFEHDGDRGCLPILPAEACGRGSMAVPGDAACREVAPCGSAPWGDIAVETTTEYVDLNYAGASDGSATAPWTSIQQAVDAASDGAIVAIAEGHYQEDVLITDKAVRLWGRCPELVSIEGTSGLAAVYVVNGGSSELRSIAVTGQTLGVLVNGSEEVVLDELWIHDNAGRGVETAGATSVTVRNTLIEGNQNIGVFVVGAATVEGSVVRDTDPAGGTGRGINAQMDLFGNPSDLVVRRSLIERNRQNSIILIGSNGTIEASVVRDTAPGGVIPEGRGLGFEDHPDLGVRSIASVTGSLIERSQGTAVYVVNSDIALETTVVRDTGPLADGTRGNGINIHDDPETASPTNLTMESVLFERNHEATVIVYGSHAVVKGAVVRDTFRGPNKGIGRGISIEVDPMSGVRPTFALQGSLLERNQEVAIMIGGADATIDSTVLRDTTPHQHFKGGHAIHVQDHPESGATASAQVRACLIERSVEAGVEVAGHASLDIDASLLRFTSPIQDLFGDGVVAWSYGGPASATLHGTRIEESARAGVSSFGASVTLENSHLVCQGIDMLAEPWETIAPALHDLGGVHCGCPEASSPCRSQASALGPPPPL